MRSALIAALCLCSTYAHAASKPPPKPSYTVELVNLPEGINCLPNTGEGADHGAVCAWRLHTNFDTILHDMLDHHLPAGGVYHARFELLSAAMVHSPAQQLSAQSRRAAYRFTLTDAAGKRVVDRIAQLDLSLFPPHRVVPELVLQAPEVYRPYVVYELFFGVADQIGRSIDAALQPGLAAR